MAESADNGSWQDDTENQSQIHDNLVRSTVKVAAPERAVTAGYADSPLYINVEKIKNAEAEVLKVEHSKGTP